MTSATQVRVPSRLQSLAATAVLLERLERTPRSSASADQYRSLVQQLDGLLDGVDAAGFAPDSNDARAFQALLESLPALAELHENRHYAAAGLCRSPLEAAVEAELEARTLLARVAKPR